MIYIVFSFFKLIDLGTKKIGKGVTELDEWINLRLKPLF